MYIFLNILRIRDNELAAANNLPKNVEYMKICNLHYYGKTFDLVFSNGKVERCEK